MKTIFLLLGVFAAANSLPFSADPEYAMVPDIDGTFKLINVNENLEPETFFNPHEDIIFTLFTNNGPAAGEVISWNSPSSILASSFNPANPTRITVHGWNGGPGARVNTATRNSLFQVGQFNQITVDWSAGAGTLNYIAARNRVGGVGAVVGDLVRLLVSTTGADTRQMSVIGHSLGAHVAGFAGKSLGTGNFRLGSIVALDAALPLFSINNPAERVADTDADYVESIHTNAGLLGFDQPLGHANFYPNMGVSQPGCGIDLSGNCAHARSHEFYAESISSPVGFWGRPCGGWDNISNGECIHNGGTYERMGGEPVQENNPRGVFWFETNAEAPFAQGR